MGLPIVTLVHFGTQLESTAAIVSRTSEVVGEWGMAHPERIAAEPMGAWKRWRNRLTAWLDANRQPLVWPLPPPLPTIFVRPQVWRALVTWDREARGWARRWAQLTSQEIALPPEPEPPQELSPGDLGLDLSASGSAGLGAVAGFLLAAWLMRR